MNRTIITPSLTPPKATSAPSLEHIQQAKKSLEPLINLTPLCPIRTDMPTAPRNNTKALRIKLELWQKTGTFKIRSALLHIQQLKQEKECRVVALSGGNHALAVSYACHLCQIPAVVIMPKHASPLRIQACRDLNATVYLEESLAQCFQREEEFRHQGYNSIHPFEGPLVATGTGTLGLEILEQWPECDVIISALGGGGLCSGVAHATHLINPHCQVFGVEPEGANAMSQSFIQDATIPHIKTQTIADSLAAPCSLPYSYNLCRQHLAGIVNVSEKEIQDAMRFSFEHLKLALEPAAATTIAALHGPLSHVCENKNVTILACGSNIDVDSFYSKLKL